MQKFQIFRRLLSIKTTINPKSYKLHVPKTKHESLILLTTPSQLQNTISSVVKRHEESDKKQDYQQLLVACVDSILNSRNACSELWLDNKFTINAFEKFEDRQHRENSKKKDPLSVDPVKFDRNWKDNKESTWLGLKIDDHQGGCRLANTLFVNGESSTCFYVGNEKFDWHNLSTINIEIDLGIKTKTRTLNYFNRLTEIPLVENLKDEELYMVTDFEGNLIKSINDESASGYLINNSKVMDSKKDLFFKLYENDDIPDWKGEYYRLLVGGLGWGEKQAIIAIDPIVGDVGYKNIKLYYYDESKPEYPIKNLKDDSQMIVWECSELEDGYQGYHESNVDTGAEKVVDGILGIGCEQGFEVDGVWHRSHGEAVEFIY